MCVRTRFDVGFRLLEKVSVNGPSTHPIFQWLRIKGGVATGGDNADADAIMWNFNLFLVERDGETCTRYSNSRTPMSLRDDILRALGEAKGADERARTSE